jgi:hypothetical protein
MLEVAFNNFYKTSSPRLVLEAEGGIIKHLTHLEELILTRKKEGVDTAISFIGELLKTFESNTQSRVFTTVKYDGAPAIICGINPENKQFFVATKSVAAANPKINYTEQDVERNHGDKPGLADKLKLALRYLPNVIKSNVYQGDFMFDKSTLYPIEHEGEELIAFKPNTIVYAVPKNSELGKKVLNSEIGIVFHTRYTGKSLQNLSKQSDVNVTEFNIPSNVFVDDAKFKDVSGTATFTAEESKHINEITEAVKAASNTVKWDSIPDSVYTSLNVFINSLIRDNRFVTDPETSYNEFINWLSTRAEKEITALKTPAGQDKKRTAFNTLKQQIETSKLSIINLFNLTSKLEQIKKIFIQKYNSAINTKQFIVQQDGTLKVTAPEGYVAVDDTGNMVKLVDRLEFSRANFAVDKDKKFS